MHRLTSLIARLVQTCLCLVLPLAETMIRSMYSASDPGQIAATSALPQTTQRRRANDADSASMLGVNMRRATLPDR